MTGTLAPTRTAELRERATAALHRCGADPDMLPGTGRIEVVSPVTGEAVATVPCADGAEIGRASCRERVYGLV